MTRSRLRIAVRGAVQGVGFRPFVHRLAGELQLGGWVRNEGADLVIEAEGEAIAEFLERVTAAPPAGARIDAVDIQTLPEVGESTMVIAPSHVDASPRSVVPDRVACVDCVREIFDPASRYFGYPFTNCTCCGPRYSIVERLPYDRANTTMAGFSMCSECRTAYDAPQNRRFHAQPTACPACGPQLRLLDNDGAVLQHATEAISTAAQCLRQGWIVALKGLGGYQLLVDATDRAAVRRLRERKHRPHKPFAVMVASLDAARAICHIDPAEVELLCSAAGPIVLLRSLGRGLAEGVHPHQVETGVMLPTTPLHHLLLRQVGRPLVCTSGNLGEEPLCIDDTDALCRLSSVADRFLTHDRPIRRPVDDSVARVIDGAPQVLRLGRGYAPLTLSHDIGVAALATGPHLKNAVAVAEGGRIVVGPHVGDLGNTLSIDAMHRQTADLQAFFAVTPVRIACDGHPDYASTVFAHQRGRPVTEVQHHLAHALAALVEHDRRGPVLAVVWDGAGLGSDGTIWGGEFLTVEFTAAGVAWSRIACLRPFGLLGGEAAARQPSRVLAAMRHEVDIRDPRIPAAYRAPFERGGHSRRCSSAGRLFDGVAALLGHVGEQTYEGMAASLLERDAWLADNAADSIDAPELRSSQPAVLDWEPTLRALQRAHDAGRSAANLSAAFHRALATAIVRVAHHVPHPTVVLTGGCFQNRMLTELASRQLRRDGFEVLLARRLPPNDGGIAVGQLAAIHGAHENVFGDSRSN